MQTRSHIMILARRLLRHGSHRHYTNRVIDLRSDTLTSPSEEMLQFGLNSPTGDDVFGEDPTVQKLEEYTADLFGKESGLYVPTGTMANLTAILAHCHGRASEIIIGANSHICLWEGGNVANVGGVHSRQLQEDDNDATLNKDMIRDLTKLDIDDHWPKTELLCLENTQNMMGGVALPPNYIDSMGVLTQDLGIALHIDGARIFNAVVAHRTSPERMCQNADSVAVCLSKGLGAPLGSVLVGPSFVIRLAKRARKRLGGGMRQAGIVAGMGLYAIQNNVERLQHDHNRAKRLASVLHENEFKILRDGQIDTNIVYFSLPTKSDVKKENFASNLMKTFGVKVTGGYGRGGSLFRACTHLDVNDDDIERAAHAIVRASFA
jgi:threonine aldolase